MNGMSTSAANAATNAAAVVTVQEIMMHDVITTTPDRPVEDLARELDQRAISGMPVVDERGALVGIVSEYDIISKRGRTVGEIMSRGVIGVGADATAEQVAATMGLHGIRLVPVTANGRLLGVVSRADLVRLYASTRWTCTACGSSERGITRPTQCARCAATTLRLEREDTLTPNP